jgi:hypothetical protein
MLNRQYFFKKKKKKESEKSSTARFLVVQKTLSKVIKPSPTF